MAGYTRFAKAAGRYTEEEAIEICRDARSHGEDGTPPPETMIREDCIRQSAAARPPANEDAKAPAPGHAPSRGGPGFRQ